MFIYTERKRPDPWSHYRGKARQPILIPLHWLEWACRWLAYWLSGWAFLEVLEYIGTLSIFFAVISYFAESGDRIKQKHYQAWQVINTAQGKGGAGGRIDALEELNKDGVPLVGVDLSGAFLQGLDLQGANLARADFSSADVRGGSFKSANLEYANLASVNVRNGTFQNANLRNATLQDADLHGANLRDADLEGVDLSKADLRNTDLHNMKWSMIADLKLANIFGVKNAPADFNHWALQKGAVSIESDADWSKLLETP
ncbi:MAG: pentapeptide repeat-containing protein [Verrucomicrobia bacterium]|nr:pentapeptide repeat-containing protein [Verrucomicrobiota bacterium]MBV9299312.1 pentapeptide repeat-containing protein [Verrucomicrobiota bacterium]